MPSGAVEGVSAVLACVSRKPARIAAAERAAPARAGIAVEGRRKTAEGETDGVDDDEFMIAIAPTEPKMSTPGIHM